jgi:hypothetical protein
VISKPIKNDFSIYGINLKKIIQQSPITILPKFLAGEFPYKIEAVFAGFEGVFMGLELWIMGSQNVIGSGYGSNISDILWTPVSEGDHSLPISLQMCKAGSWTWFHRQSLQGLCQQLQSLSWFATSRLTLG